jgi:outer membrane receptor protein involved in Fe transport
MKSKWLGRVLAGAVTALVPWLSVLAQTTNGAIQGRVLDEEGKPVIGALIEVRGPAVQAYLGSATGVEGDYKVPFVPAGKGYEVKVEAGGYATVLRKGIDVPLGVTVNLPFTLGQGRTEVVVTAAAPTVDIKSTTSGASIAESMITAVPLDRNSYTIPYLAPMAVDSGLWTSPSIAGSTGAENSYLINGVDVTAPGTGVSGFDLNFDFIQEMQVLTGGLPPEYGATMGGVVEAITRSGGNEFHGSLFAYIWTDETMAKPVNLRYGPGSVFGNQGNQIWDAGGSLGGYLIKDKLWFYAVYDYMNHEVYTQYPREPQYGDQYLYLNGAPAQSCFAGRRLTQYDAIWRQYAFKLTWNASPDQKVALSVFGTSGSENWINLVTLTPDTARSKEVGDGYSLALQWNATWSPRFFSEVDLGYRHSVGDGFYGAGLTDQYDYAYANSGFRAFPRDIAVDPVSTNGAQVDLGKNYRPSHGGARSRTKDESFQARVKMTNLLAGSAGRHELTYGLQYQRYRSSAETNHSGPGNFISPSTHLPATPVSVLWWALPSPGPHGERFVYFARSRLSPARTTASEDFAGAWANDNWSVTDYLTLKLGLRYDDEKLTGDQTGQSLRFTGNWAPRIGFTWDVRHDGKSKLFGFWGRYFERVPTSVAQRTLNHYGSVSETFYDPQLTEWTGWSSRYAENIYIQGQYLPPASQLTPALAAAYSHELKAPFTDEWILGYQYQIRPDLTLGARLVYRELTRALEDLSYDGGATFVIANPDEWTGVPMRYLQYPGAYGYLPEPVRRYEAVELTLDKRYSDRWQLSGSLVYSQLKGNYEGVASNDYGGAFSPSFNSVFDLPDNMVNSYGFLPLDRTWVFKAYGSYFFEKVPLQLSAVLKLQSGTPISQRLDARWSGYDWFATPRGSYGRTPWTWTLDLGVQYNFTLPMKSTLGLRVDVFNVFNLQRATGVDQIWEIQNEQGGPIYPNPNFGRATGYQDPPRTFRLGLRWTF